MPNLFVIAGPNGAGKSTSAPEILSGVRRVAIRQCRRNREGRGCFRDPSRSHNPQSMNNTARPGRRIASRDIGDPLSVADNALWQQLVARYMKPRVEEKEAGAAAQKLWTAEDIVDAVNRAVTGALKRHKELGQSVVVWRDGKVVWLKPEQIDV